MKTKKNEQSRNFILRLLECKKELRRCIQNGADPKEMQSIAEQYGFQFSKPI